MTENKHWYDGHPIPYLMHLARGSYGERSRSLLAQAGFDDLPRNGGIVLAGLTAGPRPAASVVGELARPAPAATALVDTLVVRGYLDRQASSAQPGQLTFGLTERGRAAAEVVQAAVDQVDRELAERLSAGELAGLRAGLAALHEIREAR